MKGKKVLAIRMNIELHKELRKYAIDQNRSMANIAEEMIKKGLENAKSK